MQEVMIGAKSGFIVKIFFSLSLFFSYVPNPLLPSGNAISSAKPSLVLRGTGGNDISDYLVPFTLNTDMSIGFHVYY